MSSIVLTLWILQICVSNAFQYAFDSAKAVSTSSQDLDLINYDSAKCICDVTYYRDYDCSCDPDTLLPSGVADTSRKTTLEKDYLLGGYPFCDGLREQVKNVIPSQINNIACLSYVNTPYHGYFYDSTDTAVTTSLDSQIDITGNTNLNSNTNHFTLSNTPNTPPYSTQITDLRYAPDFFGFCRWVPLINTDIQNYGSKCQGQVANTGTKNKINLVYNLQSSTAPLGIGTYETTTNSNDFEIDIGVTVYNQSVTKKDQGYSFGDILQISSDGSNKVASAYRFGGMFLAVQPSLTIYKLKQETSTTPNVVTCTGIASKTAQYVIYFTTIGSSDNTSYQITHCLIKDTSLQTSSKISNGIQYTFQFLSYTDILEESSYGNRLDQYVTKLFYPLQQFLSASILTLSLHILFVLCSFIFL